MEKIKVKKEKKKAKPPKPDASPIKVEEMKS